MNQLLVALSVAGSSAAAHAQPAPEAPIARPSTCAVDIVRAPDDVRGVVQDAVGGDLRCAVSLQVRIVATDGGFYLLAQDDRGRVYERIVPDADTAGALIASWAADGSPVAAPVAPPAPPPARVAYAEAAVAPPADAPAAVIAPVAPREPGETHRVTVLASLADGPDHGQAGPDYGARASIDLWTHGAWSIGVTASLAVSGVYTYGGTDLERDVAAAGLGYVARRFHLGPIELAPSFAAGEALSFANSNTYPDYQSHHSVLEGSLLVSHAVTDRVELTAGVVGRWYPETELHPEQVDYAALAGLGLAL